MSRLEKFIQDHRDEFDSEEINKNSWNNIESYLKNPKRKGGLFHMSRTVWAAAASVTVLLMVTLLYTTFRNNGKTTGSENLTGIVEYGDKEIPQFIHLIEIKQTELKQESEKHPELYKQFIKDINSLDSSFTVLKSALPANPNKEVLMEEMIKNLQLQIDLLNRQLQILKQLKQKNANYESKTI